MSRPSAPVVLYLQAMLLASSCSHGFSWEVANLLFEEERARGEQQPSTLTTSSTTILLVSPDGKVVLGIDSRRGHELWCYRRHVSRVEPVLLDDLCFIPDGRDLVVLDSHTGGWIGRVSQCDALHPPVRCGKGYYVARQTPAGTYYVGRCLFSERAGRLVVEPNWLSLADKRIASPLIPVESSTPQLGLVFLSAPRGRSRKDPITEACIMPLGDGAGAVSYRASPITSLEPGERFPVEASFPTLFLTDRRGAGALAVLFAEARKTYTVVYRLDLSGVWAPRPSQVTARLSRIIELPGEMKSPPTKMGRAGEVLLSVVGAPSRYTVIDNPLRVLEGRSAPIKATGTLGSSATGFFLAASRAGRGVGARGSKRVLCAQADKLQPVALGYRSTTFGEMAPLRPLPPRELVPVGNEIQFKGACRAPPVEGPEGRALFVTADAKAEVSWIRRLYRIDAVSNSIKWCRSASLVFDLSGVPAPSGERLFVGAAGALCVLDLRTGAAERLAVAAAAPGRAPALVPLAGGPLVALGRGIEILDVSNTEQPTSVCRFEDVSRSLSDENYVTGAVRTPDDTRLGCVTRDGDVYVLELPTLAMVRQAERVAEGGFLGAPILLDAGGRVAALSAHGLWLIEVPADGKKARRPWRVDLSGGEATESLRAILPPQRWVDASGQALIGVATTNGAFFYSEAKLGRMAPDDVVTPEARWPCPDSTAIRAMAASESGSAFLLAGEKVVALSESLRQTLWTVEPAWSHARDEWPAAAAMTAATDLLCVSNVNEIAVIDVRVPRGEIVRTFATLAPVHLLCRRGAVLYALCRDSRVYRFHLGRFMK